jgi:hypothetical protein
VSRIAYRAIFLGHVEAPDDVAAFRKAVKEFQYRKKDLLLRRHG